MVSGQFEEEFSHLYRSARAVALRILGSIADAEDAAADALTRALVDWNHVGSLPHREAWVQRVAANIAIDSVRRRGPAGRAVDQLGAGLATTGNAEADRADEVTVLRMTMGAALARLPRRQREAVVMRHLLGCPEAEVAALLGLSANSVKKHLQRGMEKLRRLAGTDATIDGGIDAAFE